MQARRIMAAWQETDEAIAGWRSAHPATTIYCGAGCANCCHLAVHASYPEAVIVAASLDRESAAALDAHVERLLAAATELPDLATYLRRYRQEFGPCPFLSATGCCRIYRIRPLSCRTLLATRPADWCGIDLAALDHWDKQLFQQTLDRHVVAWPTHYVADTQSIGRRQELALLEEMTAESGWSMSGHFPLMVWLARTRNLEDCPAREALEILCELQLGSSPLLDLTTGHRRVEG